MKHTNHVAQADNCTPKNGPSPNVGFGGDSQYTELVRELIAKTHGKHCTQGIVADLTISSSQQLRKLVPNHDAIKALTIAQNVGCRYIILAGFLMAPKGKIIAMLVADDPKGKILLASQTANQLMAQISESTAWVLLLDVEMRLRVSHVLGIAV